MEEFIQFSAKTKNEAITKACIELGVSSDQLEIEVVSEGSSGFFGIGSKPAIIKARKINTVSEEDEIQEGVYIYRYQNAEDGDVIVEKITAPAEYKKVSKFYECM